MTENETLKACVRELKGIIKTEKSGAKAGRSLKGTKEARARAKEIYYDAIKLWQGYSAEGRKYKQLKASPRAIKANAERCELAREVVALSGALDDVLFLQEARINGRRKNLQFHINTIRG